MDAQERKLYKCKDIMGDNPPEHICVERLTIRPKLSTPVRAQEFICYYKDCKNHNCSYHFDKQHFGGTKIPTIIAC